MTQGIYIGPRQRTEIRRLAALKNAAGKRLLTMAAISRRLGLNPRTIAMVLRGSGPEAEPTAGLVDG